MLAPCCWLTHFVAEPRKKKNARPSPEKKSGSHFHQLTPLPVPHVCVSATHAQLRPKGNGPATIIRGVKRKRKKLKQPRRSCYNHSQAVEMIRLLFHSVIYGTFFFSTSAYQLVNDLAHPSSSSTEKASTTTAQTDLCWRLFIRQLSIG